METWFKLWTTCSDIMINYHLILVPSFIPPAYFVQFLTVSIVMLLWDILALDHDQSNCWYSCFTSTAELYSGFWIKPGLLKWCLIIIIIQILAQVYASLTPGVNTNNCKKFRSRLFNILLMLISNIMNLLLTMFIFRMHSEALLWLLGVLW